MPASNISGQTRGSRPLFLLGAGFNCDANEEVERFCGSSYDLPSDCRYPLVTDLWRDCFNILQAPANASIEEMFADSIKQGRLEPVSLLVEKLKKADHFMASLLARPNNETCYSRFFDHFQGANFLTYNYDSLPELILFNRGKWRPDDGYGVPVEFELLWDAPKPSSSKSESLVIHLHGSICLYSDEFVIGRGSEGHPMQSERGESIFRLDPPQDTEMFRPFGSSFAIGQVRPEDRIIAPVPDKSEGLKGVFVQRMYEKAREEAKSSNVLVAIGYGFSPHDKSSYVRILSALAKAPRPRLVIVAPNADQIEAGLRCQFPVIETESLKLSFKEWVDASFPGIGTTAA